MRYPAGSPRVATNDIAAAVKAPTGDRHIISRDGTILSIDPNKWRAGLQVAAAIDAVVPPDVAVETHPGLEALIHHVIHARGRESTYSSELRSLLRALEPLEQIEALVEARHVRRATGLLALSSRRLLYLTGGELQLSALRDEALLASDEADSGTGRPRLKVTAQGETQEFMDLSPQDQLDKLRAGLSG